MADDFMQEKRFDKIGNIDEFYLQVSITHGQLMAIKVTQLFLLMKFKFIRSY